MGEKMLGSYQRGDLLHKSTNSSVYVATEKKTGKLLALKEIPFRGSRERLAFYKEIELLQKLKGLPHFVQLTDFFEEQGFFYLVTEFIEGTNLREVKTGLDKLLDYFRQAAKALSLMHGQGILHGDIKGNNFLVDQNGILRFLDLGSGIYHTGEEYLRSGTLSYMSPEQLGFIRYPAGEYTDLYGLGISFYELLSGRLPFLEKEKNKLIHAILTETPPPLTQLCPGLPKIYSAIVSKLLSKDPADRYQSAAGLLFDLERAQKTPQIEFSLGSEDQCGLFKLEGNAIGLDEYTGELKRFFISQMPAFIHGGKRSGKSTLLSHLKNEYLDQKIMLIELKPENREEKGGYFSKLLALLAQELGKNTLGDFLAHKRPAEINPFLPENLRLEEKGDFPKNDLRAQEEYQTQFFLELMAFLKGLQIYLFIDNADFLDDFSLAVLVKEEFSRVLCAFSSQELPRFSFGELKAFYLELKHFDRSLQESLTKQILLDKIQRDDLDFLLDNLGEEKVYPGDLAEYLFTLKEEGLLWFEPRENNWKLKREQIKGMSLQGFYQEYLRQKLLKMSGNEKNLLKILSLMQYGIKEEDLADLSFILGENKEGGEELALISLSDSLHRQGLIFRGEGEIRLEEGLKKILLTQAEAEAKKTLLDKQNLIGALSKKRDKYYKDIVKLMQEIQHPGLEDLLVFSLEKEKEKMNFSLVFQILLKLIVLVEKADKLAEYSKSLIFYKHFFRPWPELPLAIQKMEEWTQKSDKKEEQMMFLGTLVFFAFIMGQYPRAVTFSGNLLVLARELQNYTYMYLGHTTLATVFFFSGDMEKAAAAGTEAISLKDKGIELERDAFIHAMMGLIKAVHGKKQEALAFALYGIQKAYESSELSDLAVCLHFGGFAYSYFGKADEGLEFSQEALQLAVKMKNYILEYSAHYSIAMAYLTQDILSEAEAHLLEAIRKAQMRNFVVGFDWLYRILLEVYFRQRDKKKFENTLKNYAAMENFYGKQNLYRFFFHKYKAVSALFQNDFNTAEEELRAALKISENSDVNSPLERSRLYGLFYFLYQELGEYSRAREYYAKAEMCEEVKDLPADKKYYLAKSWALNGDDSHSSLTTGSKSMKEAMAYESVLRATAVISSILDPRKMILKLMDILLETFGAEKGCFSLETEGKRYGLCCDQELKKVPRDFVFEPLIQKSREEKDALFFEHLERNFPERKGEKSVLVYPILRKGKELGYVYLVNHTLPGIFCLEDVKILGALMNQTLIAIENAIHFVREKEARARAEATMKAFELFVPSPFLKVIASEGIDSIRLGNASSKKVTIFFSDIRDFTSISEKLSPEELMKYLNRFMSEVTGSSIEKQQGFIDKFIGDAVMAVFDQPSSDASLRAAIDIQTRLKSYNETLESEGLFPIRVGIGLNTGQVIMGTIGTHSRMDSTIIGDEVNLASRLEGLSKVYGVPIIVSASTIKSLEKPEMFRFREIDSVTVVGKKIPVTIYEVFNWEEESLQELKKSYESDLLLGISFYKIREFEEAVRLFKNCAALNPSDPVVCLYLSRCQYYTDNPPEEKWDGTVQLLKK